MKRAVIAVLSMIMFICLFPMSASAEEGLKSPTVQYKLINHDEITLRWTEVEGADGYSVYRTDVETGKTVKYKNTVKGTTVEVKGLKAETEYIFQVAAVNESNGQTSIGRKSKGTKLTTPKEWYYSYSAYTNKDKVWVYNYYKENFSKTKHEGITLESLGSVTAFFYYDGWIYFITYTWSDFSPMYYVGRITEDGTDEEALFDKLYESYGYGYSYKVHGDYMYISRIYKDYNYYGDFEDFGEETFTYTADYHRISLKTGEASKICDVYISSCFDIYGDYIYFVYNPQEYNEEAKGYAYCEDESSYLGRVKVDGTEDKEILYKLPDDIYGKMYIYEDEIYFLRQNHQKSIIKLSLSGGDPITVCENTPYIDDFEIVNGYIYFTEYESHSDIYYKSRHYSDYDIKIKAYYRIKTDGTDLTKRSTPFEWRY